MKTSIAVSTQEHIRTKVNTSPYDWQQSNTQHADKSPLCEAYHDAHEEDGDDWRNYD